MESTALSIPRDLSEVTPTWLGRVLGSPVASITPVRVGEGVGLMGELYRVAVEYEPGATGPAHVIVKLPSQHEGSRAQGVALGTYEAEVRFYNELADQTAARVPHCYHAQIVPGTAEFVVVLEDLSNLALGDQHRGLTKQEAELVVDCLADVHASWWGKVTTPAYEWIPSIVHPRIEMVAGMWPDLWSAFTAGFGHRLPPGGAEAGERVRDNYWKLMTALSELPWTLLHQDARGENMFFGDPAGPDALVMFDWQSIGRGPGAYDLAYTLGGSLSVPDRRAYERELVQRYRDRLQRLGVRAPSFDDMWFQYRRASLVTTATAVFAGATLDTTNERGFELVCMMGERHFSQVVDLQSVDTIP